MNERGRRFNQRPSMCRRIAQEVVEELTQPKLEDEMVFILAQAVAI